MRFKYCVKQPLPPRILALRLIRTVFETAVRSRQRHTAPGNAVVLQGSHLGNHPSLVQVIQGAAAVFCELPFLSCAADDVCKYLLANSQSKHLYILSLTLRLVLAAGCEVELKSSVMFRLVFDMFSSVKEHLKVQLEVFFTRYSVLVATCSLIRMSAQHPSPNRRKLIGQL